MMEKVDGKGRVVGNETINSAPKSQREDPPTACIDAVVRFMGKPFDATVEFFSGKTGKSLGSSPTVMGVAAVNVPLDISGSFTEVFAAVQNKEYAPGEWEGVHYDYVDRRATGFIRLVHDSQFS